jgi:predicted transcriptional regulator
MTRLLEQAIAGSDTADAQLDSATRGAIREGLEQAERGEFVPDSVVAEADRRHGI